MYAKRDNIDEFIVETVFNDSGVAQGFKVIGKEQVKVLKNNEKLEKSNERVAKSQREAAKTGFQLGKALRALGLYIGVREIVKYADEWQRIANTLSQVTKSDRERIALQEKLYQIGRRTRTSASNTVDLYSGLGSFGLSGQQQLNATELLQRAFKASGSSQRAVESIKRMLQTGKLTSLIGINQNLAQIIASGMNMNLEQLQQRIKKGGLTSVQVLQAISNKTADINKGFSKTKTTLGEALSLVSDSLSKFFGRLEERTGLFSKTAELISLLADNIEIVANVIGGIFLLKFAKSVEVLDLFFLNLKDGMGILGSLKAVLVALKPAVYGFATAMWALTAPLLKVWLVLEGIWQIIKWLKGEDNIFSDIEKLSQKFGQSFEQKKASFFGGNPLPQANVPNSNPLWNSTFNNYITVNEARDGLMSADHLLETQIKQVNSSGS